MLSKRHVKRSRVADVVGAVAAEQKAKMKAEAKAQGKEFVSTLIYLRQAGRDSCQRKVELSHI